MTSIDSNLFIRNFISASVSFRMVSSTGVSPSSPPVVHTTVILSTVTTLATSRLTTGELTRTTMVPIGSSRAPSSSKPSVHSTMPSRRWSSTFGEMVS